MTGLGTRSTYKTNVYYNHGSQEAGLVEFMVL